MSLTARFHRTREQAIDYFRQNTPLSEGDMVTEVERFFVWPAQKQIHMSPLPAGHSYL